MLVMLVHISCGQCSCTQTDIVLHTGTVQYVSCSPVSPSQQQKKHKTHMHNKQGNISFFIPSAFPSPPPTFLQTCKTWKITWQKSSAFSSGEKERERERDAFVYPRLPPPSPISLAPPPPSSKLPPSSFCELSSLLFLFSLSLSNVRRAIEKQQGERERRERESGRLEKKGGEGGGGSVDWRVLRERRGRKEKHF